MHAESSRSFAGMLAAVRRFHEEKGLPVDQPEDHPLMFFRMSLMIEELGEIAAALTKEKGDLAEEHADLLILLLGNAVTAGIDLEQAFWSKMEKLRKRTGRVIRGQMRVTSAEGETGSTTPP